MISLFCVPAIFRLSPATLSIKPQAPFLIYNIRQAFTSRTCTELLGYRSHPGQPKSWYTVSTKAVCSYIIRFCDYSAHHEFSQNQDGEFTHRTMLPLLFTAPPPTDLRPSGFARMPRLTTLLSEVVGEVTASQALSACEDGLFHASMTHPSS